DREIAEALARFAENCANSAGAPGTLFLKGPLRAGQAEAAEAVARSCGAPLLIADVERANECQTDWETAMPGLFRDAVFRKAVLYLEGADLLPRRMLESLMDSYSGVVIASGQQALPNWFSLSLPFPGLEASRRTWERAAAEQGLALSSGNAKVL